MIEKSAAQLRLFGVSIVARCQRFDTWANGPMLTRFPQTLCIHESSQTAAVAGEVLS